ncbi:MAG: amidohydrolase family protein [Acidimicrobiia bacterium]|nr:amidohydrolase family protein [Acidimicrobiia bacterium]MYC57460.1 amidohydrolase family protein [Acidimicrobiia bacterium]MYG93981.1 amidohydrolase family protein [Acidimicrobiia bacterium]MYI30052.1 amidohydrolase family protein [Acidimicrobiia bacterium]
MTAISADRILTAAGWLDKAEVSLADGRIERIESVSRPVAFSYLAPGFIDIQVNGFDSIDLATSSPDTWPALALGLVSRGVTSWLPTLISRPLDAYAAWLEDVRVFAGGVHGPRVLGVHLEGPWLGGLVGAHVDVAKGSIDVEWCRSLSSTVRIVTLGPERPGAIEAIEYLCNRGIIVAAGHSNANRRAAQRAFDAGVSLLTHCFNATTPIHQREPGLTGLALVRDDVYISLIADGQHVHPDILKIAVRAKGPERTILVSDSSGWAAGALGATKIQLIDGAPRKSDGGLAGSALTLDAAIRYMVNNEVLRLDDALRCTSTVPAQLLGASEIGVIRIGAEADLVALDDNLQVVAVWVSGKQIV